jgi:hypothetical protein
MASDDDPKETYVAALIRQTDFFRQKFGCSTSPSFYVIHYDDGAAHWSMYPWGWDLRYLNLEKGDKTSCGEPIGRGITICQKCHQKKRDEIRNVCREFERELKENHKDTIDKEISKEAKFASSQFHEYYRNLFSLYSRIPKFCCSILTSINFHLLIFRENEIIMERFNFFQENLIQIKLRPISTHWKESGLATVIMISSLLKDSSDGFVTQYLFK